MKHLRKATSLIAALLMLLTAVVPAFAVTVPELAVTSNSYVKWDRIVPEEIREMDVGDELQLYAIIKYGNEMGMTPEENGWFVESVLSDGVIWESADESVATVDAGGKVTGTGAGRTTVTASLDRSVYGENSFSLPWPPERYEASFGITVNVDGVPFSDVKHDAYYADAVAWAVANNITNGTNDTTFSPDDPCTRGQVVTFLWRAIGEPEPTAAFNRFSDVKEDDYFYKAVLWAIDGSITMGTSDYTFSPDAPCTRAEIVTFLYRYAKGSAAEAANPFTDVAAADYFYAPVMWAVANNITKGTSNTTFSPNDTCTRGQVVTFLYRAEFENSGKRGKNSGESQKNDIESLFVLNGEEYGRLIASSESAEDAVRVCTRHFTDTRYEGYYNTVTDCSVIYESDILYGLNVKWEVGEGEYEENVISIKKNVADITVNNVVYGDKDSFRILTDSKEQIEKVLLYLFKYKTRPSLTLSNRSVNGYEFTENDSEYVLTADTMMIVYGDWGLEDEYYYYNVTLKLDKTTRYVEYQKQEISQ